MKTRLIFVRHAEAEGNAKREFHGWTDSELTQKGHIQAKTVAERLKKMDIDILYSSSLKRTLQTAQYISEVKGLPIIRTDKLKEINVGDWEGRPWTELPERWPEEYRIWETEPHLHKAPNGESMKEFQKRLIDEVLYIIKHNEGRDICVVTHGTAIKALQCYFRQCSLDEMLGIGWQDNTAITIIEYEDGGFRVVSEGDATHLGEGLSTIAFQKWWKESKAKESKQTRDEGETRQLKPSDRLVKLLFQTGAIRVSPEKEPFWYTSGTIGPYYINTHFLFGGEEKAGELLRIIDEEKENVLTCPLKVLEHLKENYGKDPVYREVVDGIIRFIKKNIDIDEIDYVSGGERRDWFFSLLLSEIMGKPHITIYKDLTTVVYEKGVTENPKGLQGKNVLHVADLITRASSYERGWIPAVEKTGAKMLWSLVVIDRMQGGSEYLSQQGIRPYSMINVDGSLFNEALSLDIINDKQYSVILKYLDNPETSMKKFLEENPEFLTGALNSGTKVRERAKLCIEKDIYGLGREYYNRLKG